VLSVSLTSPGSIVSHGACGVGSVTAADDCRPRGSHAGGTRRSRVAREFRRPGRLVQLPLSSVEQHFAAQFPGRIGRFSDGQRNIIMRLVDQPTRLLHPAADCFRGSGYRVERARVRQDEDGSNWSCFRAQRDAQQRTVVRAHF